MPGTQPRCIQDAWRILFNDVLLAVLGYHRPQGADLQSAKHFRHLVEIFINPDTNTLKNELIFKRRITGLYSYFYGIVGGRLPELNTILENIPMSDYQYKMYEVNL